MVIIINTANFHKVLKKMNADKQERTNREYNPTYFYQHSTVKPLCYNKCIKKKRKKGAVFS